MQFSVKKIEVLVFIVFFALFTSLGVWQLNRADEKRAIEKRINSRSAGTAFVLSDSASWDTDEIEYQKIKVSGEFLSTGQLLIDNIMVNSQPGYHVMTPLKIANTEQHIMVNRGWVAQGKSRQQLPDVNFPTGIQTVEGIVRTPSHLPFVESSVEVFSPAKQFSVWLYLDIEKYQNESPLKLVPFAMLQNNDTGDGLLREWPAYRAKTGMHIGYAIQWFAFAIIVAVIFVGIGRKRGKEAIFA